MIIVQIQNNLHNISNPVIKEQPTVASVFIYLFSLVASRLFSELFGIFVC